MASACVRACRNLRRLFLDAATSVGVPDAVDWAQRAFNSWMKYETRSDIFSQLISLMYSPSKATNTCQFSLSYMSVQCLQLSILLLSGSIPPDYAVIIYSVGIHHGGETEWDYLWQKAHETTVASQAEIMMRALAATQKTWLLWRYARWTLDASKVRMQDVSNVFNYYSHSPLGRSVASDFLLTNWDEINNRCVAN